MKRLSNSDVQNPQILRQAIEDLQRRVTDKNVTYVDPPSTATSTGKAGQVSMDSSYLYVCTATDTWKRVAIAAW